MGIIDCPAECPKILYDNFRAFGGVCAPHHYGAGLEKGLTNVTYIGECLKLGYSQIPAVDA